MKRLTKILPLLIVVLSLGFARASLAGPVTVPTATLTDNGTVTGTTSGEYAEKITITLSSNATSGDNFKLDLVQDGGISVNDPAVPIAAGTNSLVFTTPDLDPGAFTADLYDNSTVVQTSGGVPASVAFTVTPPSSGTVTSALNFSNTPAITCDDTDRVCSFNVNVVGNITGTISITATLYPQSVVSQNPTDPTQWQGGAVLTPLYPNGSVSSLTPGQTYSLTVAAGYDQLKALGTQFPSDTIFYPIISYNVTSGAVSGIPTTGSSGESTQVVNISLIDSGTNPAQAATAAGSSQESCGTGDSATLSATPSGNQLCSTYGTYNNDMAVTSTSWTWSCTGVNGGTTDTCTAQAAAGVTPTIGGSTQGGGPACGSANGQTMSTAPSGSALCSVGTVDSVVANLNGWTWNCDGSVPYQPAPCSATIGSSGSSGGSSSPSTLLQNPFKNLSTFPQIIAAVVNNIVLPIAIPFIALMLIYSGFLFVIAKRESNVYNLEKAKTTLRYTLIGAALVLGAFVIANALQATLNALIS